MTTQPTAPGTNDRGAAGTNDRRAGAPGMNNDPGVAITLHVAEAPVEDIGRAVARLAPADLVRVGARPGDILKVSGRTVAIVRAELSVPGEDGVIQIDGTARSNCGAGLQELVSVARTEYAHAVSVRFSGLWAGPARPSSHPIECSRT